MLARDRVTLRNLVLAIIAGMSAAFLIGTTCLGRDVLGPQPEESAMAAPNFRPFRSTATGIAVGTTNVTSLDEPSGTASSAAEDAMDPTRAMPTSAPAARRFVAPPASAASPVPIEGDATAAAATGSGGDAGSPP
jgi:hypothetical protein